MNRRVQHLLAASASALAIGAGAVAAHAGVTGKSGFGIEAYGGTDGMLADEYVMTDTDANSPTLPTVVVGVTATDVADAQAVVDSWGDSDGIHDGLSYYYAEASKAGNFTLRNGGSFTVQASATATPAANTTGAANALAEIESEGYGAVGQEVYAVGDLKALISNAGTLAVVADANATAVGDGNAATAGAAISAGVAQYGASNTADASIALDNSATLNVAAAADAVGDGASQANAGVYGGVLQAAMTNGEHAVEPAYVPQANVALTNAATGTINITADALADGATAAAAGAVVYAGFAQDAYASDGVGSVALTNNGAINIAANATAATPEVSYAPDDVTVDDERVGAQAIVLGGIVQNGYIAYAPEATALTTVGSKNATFTNNKTLTVNAKAVAAGSVPGEGGAVTPTKGDAAAQALVLGGVVQGPAVGFVGGFVEDIQPGDLAPLLGDILGGGEPVLFGGELGPDALPAGVVGVSDVITNAGAASFGANALASATGAAAATAGALGYVQAEFGPNVSLALTNSSAGSISVPVASTANGDSAIAAGIGIGSAQVAIASGTVTPTNPVLADVSYANAGKVDVKVLSNANGAEDALAVAGAVGHIQVGVGADGLVSFSNTGTFGVSAEANAVQAATATGNGAALAGAVGYVGVAAGPGAGPDLKIENAAGATFNVSADAEGADGAVSIAAGIVGVGGSAAAATPTAVAITNAGTLNVTARAIDTDASTTSPSTADAFAGGIALAGNIDGAVVTNKGTIQVSAITNGGAADAYGIGFLGASDSGVAGQVITINNEAGTIIARTSQDGGTTWKWGTAIDTELTQGEVVVNLSGATGKYGKIYGDIELEGDSTVNVLNGETHLDGRILGAGQVNIAANGTLFLENNPGANGPSHVIVDDFNIAPKGILAIEAPIVAGAPTNALIDYHTYPYVDAITADISGGLLEIRPASGTGLYGNNFYLEDVIIADTLTGTLADAYTRSVLLDVVDVHYDDDTYGVAAGRDTVDVGIKRVAFNAVPGLDINETSVATAIEGTYAPALAASNPAYASVLADLFKIEDATKYASALEQLAATQYAGYLRSSTMAGARFNGLIYDMAECGKGSITNELCRSENGGPRLWVTGNYGRVSTDGDNEAAGFKAEQYWIAAGLDFAVSPNFVLGVAGGYLENNNKFKANEYGYKGGDRVKSSGWQAGIYGNYDTGKFYVKGALSYSDLDGDGRRTIDFSGLGASYLAGPTMTTHGLITSDPDVNVWAAGAEAGVRFPLGENATITPYASLDYAHAKLKRFTEESADASAQGALLTVRGSDEFFASELGLELAAQWGNISPYIRGGWQHNFGDKRAKFTGAFVNAPAGTSFDVISERFAPDAGVVEVGLAAQFSPNFNAHLGYQGRFSSNVEEHTGGLTLSYLFGGAEPAAPPPPAPPAPPPPPPPAPPQVVCNKGPYIVFFDWDKSDITPEAATILDSAVTAYGNCDVVPIMLAGYTDRSGSDRYNMGLSARRNTSVRGYLTSRGIPDERISSQAFGEANPRVPTADGVRELQNRRVEITYGPGSGN
ncbi:autotransporter domain-containing protein [Caenibius tardaugens NBRC 16725]|nr:autotransporter domain-containing protein [Caenibius tardaugens NBRC 16725]